MPMNLMGLFKSPENELEGGGKKVASASQDSEVTNSCPVCAKATPISQLWDNHNVCACGYHFRMTARQRVAYLTDEFEEMFRDLRSTNVLDFPGYEQKLKTAQLTSREIEGVICGKAVIKGIECVLFIMEPEFMMGSMGTIVGEKITKSFEFATENNLPVIAYTVSGGARMQEGILSLMQMAKTSAAVKRHSESGGLYIVVLTDPTTGGVTASFAMEGDIIMAEPSATVGFAGRRVVEQTIRKKLPAEFQKAEFVLEHGFCDLITPRKAQKKTLADIMSLHGYGEVKEDV
ncbi:MAG: acetyl-CoA carboxylase carboxyltransferase subunit beta [Clostridia bacterium]